MPVLDWIGKKNVINHHKEVPFHLLKATLIYRWATRKAATCLFRGILALKALLPYYAGRVKCIYIDPPYNTGNENGCITTM